MTDREKIIKIIAPYVSAYGDDEAIADALISAGIGDVSCLREHRVIAEYSLVPDDDNPYIIPNVPLRVTQLHSGEEVEKMAKERKELKDELRSKVEYIHEQDEVIKEYKHRAEIAERALLRLCDETMHDVVVIMYPNTMKQVKNKQELYDYCMEQAEKELAEEGKDD